MCSDGSYAEKIFIDLSIIDQSIQNVLLPPVNQEATANNKNSNVLQPEGHLDYYYKPEPPPISTLPIKPKKVNSCSPRKTFNDKWFLMFLLMSCCFLACAIIKVSDGHHPEKPNNLPKGIMKITFKPDASENDTYTKNVPKRRIVVDPIFGGHNHGPVYGNVKAKDLNMRTALKVSAYLRNKGYEVKLTRSPDSNDLVVPTLRAAMANEWKADLFVSVGSNDAPHVPAVTGVEVWYNWQSEKAKALATIMAQEVSARIRARNRGIKTWGEGVQDFTVLRETGMPAVMAFGGFMSNPGELEKLKDNGYSDKIAVGIANAVITYMDSLYKF